MTKNNIALVGFACAGKTTVGKLLAPRADKGFVDIDDEIRRLYPDDWQRFRNGDEQAFRRAERSVVDDLSQCADTVIACGGGTPLADNFCRLSQNSIVVWLFITPDTVKQRLGNVPRPLFDNLSCDELAEYVSRRNKLYEKIADLTVFVDGKTPDEIADETIASLQKK